MILSQEEIRDVAKAGGKAAALARLAAHGFDVPPFLVVDPARWPPDQASAAALATAVTRLGPGPFAVRSSGREEDGAAHSHAGQFLSLLEVPASKIADAVQKVVESGRTDSLMAYRTRRGLDAKGGEPAVIVQRMVPARAAGVAFSADPVTGRRDRMVISATAGLGDRLVGGEVDGETYLVDRTSGATIEKPEGGGPLSDSDLSQLKDLVERVEAACGSPQDIEWAFDRERLHLLQSRPITTTLCAPLNADSDVTIFDNSNIVESYPGLVSPLTYSFAQKAYARVYRAFLALTGVSRHAIRDNGAALENMLGRYQGRVYYNLGNWYRLLALLPGFRLNRTHMETMMGVAEALPADIADRLSPPPARGLEKIAEAGRILRMAAKLTWEALRLQRTIRAFNVRLERALKTDRQAIQAMGLSQLAGEYRRIEADLLDRWDAPLINDFLCMMAFGASRKMLERWLGEAGAQLHNDILIGQGDIISAEPPQRIQRMGRLAAGRPELIAALSAGDRTAAARVPELDRDIAAYLEKFGDRCAEELKLESITLDENPAPLLASIAAAAQTQSGPKPAPSGNVSQRLNELLPGQPLKRAIARLALRLAKARVRDRENLRFERTRIFGHARRVFVAMGRQLHAAGQIEDPRDIFCLTVEEVLGAIEGFGVAGDLKGLIAIRKAESDRDRLSADPGDRMVFTGAVVTSKTAAAPKANPQDHPEKEWKGTGCSAGTVTATARVVKDPAASGIERGEILVAQHTDPGWIALFANASAIVVERGSLLSHSAIVAREMGIPCVVGLKGAMTAFASGDTLEVDGGTGRVRKLS